MASPNVRPKTAWTVIVIAAFLSILFVMAVHTHHRRHKHQVKLVKTKSHHVYVENDDGSCYTFTDSAGGTDIDLPRQGSTSFRTPQGTWVKTNAPREDDVEEEEEAEVEEGDAGEPEASADGDIGADSDGADAAGDSSGDSGGGDSGGGDGGGGDGGGSD